MQCCSVVTVTHHPEWSQTLCTNPCAIRPRNSFEVPEMDDIVQDDSDGTNSNMESEPDVNPIEVQAIAHVTSTLHSMQSNMV